MRFIVLCLSLFLCSLTYAEDSTDIARAEKTISIAKKPHDQDIANRVQRILNVTGWFTNLKVTCQEGVVTLNGQTQKRAHSEWAESLAQDTDEVVAVINNVEIEKPRWLDLTPAQEETESLGKKVIAFLPYLLTSLLVMVVFSFLGVLVSQLARNMAGRRTQNVLLVELVSRMAALPMFILGLYLVLQVCGLTGIAVTVLGGTGAFGLIAGFAMQNILANYFAGIMLSLRNPYTVGDVITVAGQTGVVQKLTTRGTILVDFDGTHIIIPNSTIYNSIIMNQTSNPKTRVKFQVPITYGDSPAKAREHILRILSSTKGVLKDPESSVLVNDLQAGLVQINTLFWISSNDTSADKIKSVVLEQVREKLLAEGFRLPAHIHQLAFPLGIPQSAVHRAKSEKKAADERPSTAPEIQSDKSELLRQASQGRDLEIGRNLNKPSTES
jgi:small conductance mechanosensitive channel